MGEQAGRITDDQVRSIPLGEVVGAVDRAYRALGTGEIVNPPRRETVGRAGDPDFFRLELSADWRGPDGATRWRCRKVIEEAGNRDADGNRSLGARLAWIELTDNRTGSTVSLDAEAVTNLRTGISALLAARYLIPDEPVTLAIIGTGRVASAVVRAAERVLRIREIRATSRRRENRERFVWEAGPAVRAPVIAAESVAECLSGADVIVAAVPAAKPVLTGELARAAAHVTLVGGDPRVVLGDETLWRTRRAIPDDPEQALRSGDCVRAVREGWFGSIPWARLERGQASLADAALGRLEHLRSEPTLAILTGLAALDMAVARAAWERFGDDAQGRTAQSLNEKE